MAKTKKASPQAPAPAAGAPHAGNGRPKAACPLSRADFAARAEPIAVAIDGKEMEAEVKQFSTGSFGWFHSGKTTVEVDGVRVPVQVNLLVMAIGSKDLPPL
jgi:hypothetical protein